MAITWAEVRAKESWPTSEGGVDCMDAWLHDSLEDGDHLSKGTCKGKVAGI